MVNDYNPFSLKGKKILVIGASSGIGREIALQCAKMGAEMYVVARREDMLNSLTEEMPDGNNHVISADITTESGIAEILNAVDKCDGVVLAAGKVKTLPIPFCSRKEFDDIFNLNFFALVELARLLVKKKKVSNSGSIVFISSVAGMSAVVNGNAMYSASKAALISFTKSSALEFAPKKIRVNAIAPGMVYTPLTSGLVISEEEFKKDLENYPLRCYGEPVDIAYGAVYLLSDASKWMTGHTLVIDGGLTKC